MSANASNLKLILDQVSFLQGEEREKLMDSLCKGVTLRILKLTVDDTPVVTGVLKGAWDAKRREVISQSAERNGNKYSYTVANDTPYAEYVEYGHCTRGYTGFVEGQFIATRATNYVREHVAEAISNDINAFLKRYKV